MNVHQRINIGSGVTKVSASSRTTREGLVDDSVHDVVNNKWLWVHACGDNPSYFEDW